jgi:hypothetical protein
MAVVQISKIQVRRGLKNSGIGVPQLSSAEFAWAVDSQELFIGNGSVAEGAPYVGNTKVLTEHDNILELAASYRFAEQEPSITESVARSLQSKLDEYVSVTDFGAVGDGSTDCVAAFQNALNELFRNTTPEFKKTLMIPNGTYLFTSNLKIPSTARIRGETRDNVLLEIGNNNILFITEDGKEVAEFTSSNRPTNVNISNLTINHAQGQTVLTGVADSVLENVKWMSDYVLGDGISGNIEDSSASIYWENSLAGTKVTNIKIKDCVFESTPLAIRSDQITIDSSSPPRFDTSITFDGTRFFICNTGIVINGVIGQGNLWRINDCEFEEIAAQAFTSDFGRGTIFQRSRFINCGNDTNTAATPTSSIIKFGEKSGNAVVNCTSNRHQAAGFTATTTKYAITEVENANRVSLVDMNYDDIYLSDGFKALSVFSAFNRYTYIDYILQLGDHARAGQIIIMVNESLGEFSFTDNYSYSTLYSTTPEGILMTNFVFNVELKDNDGDSGIDTLLLSYRNPQASGQTGTVSYSISYGV